MGIDILLFVVGLVLLYFGAEFLVAGSSAVALRLGIAPLVVGLTVVAFGTSSPELLVCLTAAYEGTDDISVGNIVGSNIANILLILGVSSMIKPMEVHSQIVRREFAVMAVASIMLVLVALDGEIVRLEGALLAVSMVFYLLYTFVSEKKKADDGEDADAVEAPGVDELDGVDTDNSAVWVDYVKIVGGIVGLAGGAFLMVDSATDIATDMGISELVIGITIVAFGTSVPELATSVVAAFRDESDISVGNVIGSNIFNIFLVVGVTAIVMPIVVGQAAIDFDLWIMLGVGIGVWPILRSGHRIARPEGAFMLVCYAAYIVYLFVRPA
jgi:cation:H+ antiporter